MIGVGLDQAVEQLERLDLGITGLADRLGLAERDVGQAVGPAQHHEGFVGMPLAERPKDLVGAGEVARLDGGQGVLVLLNEQRAAAQVQ